MFLTFRSCRLAPNDFPTDASFLTTLKSIRDQSPLQTATLDRNPIHAHVVTSRQADVVLIENSCGPTNVAIGRRVAIEAGRGNPAIRRTTYKWLRDQFRNPSVD